MGTVLVLAMLAAIEWVAENCIGGWDDTDDGGADSPGPNDPKVPSPTEGPAGQWALDNPADHEEVISDDLKELARAGNEDRPVLQRIKHLFSE
jgi:hypothetical protein